MVNKHINKKIYKFIFLLILFIFQLFIYIIINKIKNEQIQKIALINELNRIFTNLFFYVRNKFYITSNNIENSNIDNKKNKILLCTIGKMENLYAKEFVEYYTHLGFDKIIIMDNNDLEGETFDNILQNYIAEKVVEIKDIRGLKSVQIPSYNYCYQKYMYLYDWLAFFDFDEFLSIKNKSNIKNYLYDKSLDKCQLILINWYIYDDNNLLKRDSRAMIQRFKNLKRISSATKFIVRGNMPNLMITSSHFAINTNYCNSKGELIFPNTNFLFYQEKNPIAHLKHFYTKTAEEYCNKINKGDVQFQFIKYDKLWKRNKIKNFFKYNTKTKQKLELLEKCIHID